MTESILNAIGSARIENSSSALARNLNIQKYYSSRIIFNSSSLVIQPIKVSKVSFRFFCYRSSNGMQISIAEQNSLKPISSNYQESFPTAHKYNTVELTGEVLNEVKQRIENGDTFSIFLHIEEQAVSLIPLLLLLSRNVPRLYILYHRFFLLTYQLIN